MSDEVVSGAVEIAVIEFPGSRFNGEIVPALAELVDSGIVRILDLVFVTKDADVSVAAVELADLGDEEVSGAFAGLDGDVGGLLSEEDLELAAEALSVGSSAVLIVWENSWARRLVGAIRDAGGRLVAHDRLDSETVAAASAAAASAGS